MEVYVIRHRRTGYYWGLDGWQRDPSGEGLIYRNIGNAFLQAEDIGRAAVIVKGQMALCGEDNGLVGLRLVLPKRMTDQVVVADPANEAIAHLLMVNPHWPDSQIANRLSVKTQLVAEVRERIFNTK